MGPGGPENTQMADEADETMDMSAQDFDAFVDDKDVMQ